ncbi:MAG: hypothetical protein Q8S00_08345, partial [Deltaproteobacteria bacterium]|nr:hypothetical protein [Deltaproteobacteria bacterium]
LVGPLWVALHRCHRFTTGDCRRNDPLVAKSVSDAGGSQRANVPHQARWASADALQSAASPTPTAA